MAEEEVNGYSSSLMDRNVPSQLDEEDLKAELEIELPDSQNNVMAMVEAENVGRPVHPTQRQHVPDVRVAPSCSVDCRIAHLGLEKCDAARGGSEMFQ